MIVEAVSLKKKVLLLILILRRCLKSRQRDSDGFGR
jgi:hypothetical protein